MIEIIKKLTSLSLLDFLMRDRELKVFTNKHVISICSYEPGKVTLCYLLQDQTDDDMREVRLWSDDICVEEFIKEFGVEVFEDLEKIRLEDVWALYRADRGYLTLFDGVDDVDMRITDGVKTLEEVLVFGVRSFE
ncbi:hypothetical protein [Pedobacter frigoris]|uniref:hypothetical protein n=1 Tax=Pedobacter frigoris TaxID=2571272 RepID=UPI00293123F1|nr:hypothetical protein [Pedobacter frigoris]